MLNIEQSRKRFEFNNISSNNDTDTTTDWNEIWSSSRQNQSLHRNTVRSWRIWKDWTDWYKYFVNLFHENARFVNWRFNRFHNTLTSKKSFNWCWRCCFCENICLMKSSNVLHGNEMTSQRLYWLQIKRKAPLWCFFIRSDFYILIMKAISTFHWYMQAVRFFFARFQDVIFLDILSTASNVAILKLILLKSEFLLW